MDQYKSVIERKRAEYHLYKRIDDIWQWAALNTTACLRQFLRDRNNNRQCDCASCKDTIAREPQPSQEMKSSTDTIEINKASETKDGVRVATAGGLEVKAEGDPATSYAKNVRDKKPKNKQHKHEVQAENEKEKNTIGEKEPESQKQSEAARAKSIAEVEIEAKVDQDHNLTQQGSHNNSPNSKKKRGRTGAVFGNPPPSKKTKITDYFRLK